MVSNNAWKGDLIKLMYYLCTWPIWLGIHP